MRKLNKLATTDGPDKLTSALAWIFGTAAIFFIIISLPDESKEDNTAKGYTTSTFQNLNQSQTQRYRQEIMDNVIYPCFEKAVINNNSDFAGMNTRQSVELLISMDKTGIEHAINLLMKELPGRSYENRQDIYRFGLNNCLDGMR